MIELSINNLSKYYGANRIFQTISFDVKTGEHVGLIGQNGCGKTTLMKILMRMEEYQEGEISFRKDCRLGYLNQIPVYEEGTSVIEVIMMAFETAHEIRRKMEEMEHQMGRLSGDALEKAVVRYSRLTQEYELCGGYEFETKISKVTEGLKISEQMKQLPFNSLSGGEKTRVILAKLLLEEPDILLLDEPTNHLDLATTGWLEEFLKGYRGAALIISHDRYFLDNVVTRIIELNSVHAEEYLGNYSYYVVEKEQRFLIDLKNYKNQQKKIERMEQQIERYRIWGAMRDSEVMYKRAKELEKRMEKIEVLDRPILSKRKIRLDKNSAGRSGKIVIEAIDLGKIFDDRVLLKNASLNVFYQDSVCIIGENGCGKSTLLKMILGETELGEGAVKIGSQVIIGYLPQQIEFPDEEQTVLEYFAGTHNIPYGEARSQLAKVLFLQEDVNKKIKFLSGGEKSRLRLCSLTFDGVNLLVLDEPTNHLDIDSREVLEETLLNFDGTLLFVSHDRYFINKVADKIVVLENCRTREYDGDYTYYQNERKKEEENQKAALNSRIVGNDNGSNSTKRKDTASSASWKEKSVPAGKKNARKLELLEQRIEMMEEQVKNLELQMEIYNSDSARLKELFEEKEKLADELMQAYTEWDMLQE